MIESVSGDFSFPFLPFSELVIFLWIISFSRKISRSLPKSPLFPLSLLPGTGRWYSFERMVLCFFLVGFLSNSAPTPSRFPLQLRLSPSVPATTIYSLSLFDLFKSSLTLPPLSPFFVPSRWRHAVIWSRER